MKRQLKDDLSISWDILKNLVFFLGIYLFFIGWLFLYFYFNRFGISFSSIGLDIPSYYNHGFFALMYGNIFSVFSLVTFLLFIIYFNRGEQKWSYVLIIILIVTLFVSSFYFTRINATEKATKVLKKQYKLNAIYFDFSNEFLKSLDKDTVEKKLLHDSVLNRSEIGKGSLKLLHFNNQLQLYLIYENSNEYFVIFNPLKKNEKLMGDVQIFNINKKDINYATKLMSFDED